MTIIADKDRSTVQNLLATELIVDVDLLLFTRGRSRLFVPGTQDCQTCDETRELLDELVRLSNKLHLTTYDVGADPAAATPYNVRAVPTVIVRRRASATETAEQAQETAGSQPGSPADRDLSSSTARSTAAEIGANVRFLGLPAGYEFSTLLADIVDVSKGRTDLAPATLEAVRAIDAPVHIQVFVTPSCPYCPRAARVAHQMAMENPLILADVIEANEFAELSERYRVQSVPKTIINDRIEFVGSLPEAKMLEALQKAVEPDAE